MSRGQRGTNMTLRTTFSSRCRVRRRLRSTMPQKLCSRLSRDTAVRSSNERRHRKRATSSGKTARMLSSPLSHTLAVMPKVGSRTSGRCFHVLFFSGQFPDCDHSVPVSNLPQLIEETQKDIEAHGIKYLTAGHAGDGEG